MPRSGRPTDNPKPYRINVRIDEKCKTILEKYSEQENISQMEVVRQAIKRLEAELKDK